MLHPTTFKDWLWEPRMFPNSFVILYRTRQSKEPNNRRKINKEVPSGGGRISDSFPRLCHPFLLSRRAPYTLQDFKGLDILQAC
jgi:hypothetical protein